MFLTIPCEVRMYSPDEVATQVHSIPLKILLAFLAQELLVM